MRKDQNPKELIKVEEQLGVQYPDGSIYWGSNFGHEELSTREMRERFQEDYNTKLAMYNIPSNFKLIFLKRTATTTYSNPEIIDDNFA